MKHYTKPILAFVITVAVCYLAMAFAMWEWNPVEWNKGIRAAFAFSVIVLGALSSLITVIK